MGDMLAERTAIIVIGMHRSGSSAMARMLSLAGAALPKALMSAGHGNEAGHWEPQRVADYNDVVLAAFDAVWDSPFGLGMNARRRTALEPFLEGARDIIRDEYADASVIVLKEPRISLVADLWTRACEAEGFRCKFVIMVRPPTEVASSLRKRNGFALDKGLLLWGAYQASSEQLTRAHDRIFCRYDDLLARPASVLDDIEAKLRIELPCRTAQAHAAMDAFIRPELKRNHAESIPDIPAHLKPIGELSDYISASLLGEKPNVDMSRALQAWFSDLDQTMTPLMVGLAQQLRAQQENAVALVHGQAEAYRGEIERLHLLYSEQSADVARLNEKVSEVDLLRLEAEGQLANAGDARQVVQDLLDARDAEIIVLRGALEAANAALLEMSATLEGRTAAFDAARAEWHMREAELDATLHTVRVAHEELAARHECTLVESSDEAATAHRREAAMRVDLQERIDALEAAARARADELAATAEDRTRLQGALDDVLADRERVRVEIERVRCAEVATAEDRTRLQGALDDVLADRERVHAEIEQIRGTEAATAEERTRLQGALDDVLADRERMRAEIEQIRGTEAATAEERMRLQGALDDVLADRERMRAEIEQIRGTEAATAEDRTRLQGALDDVLAERERMRAEIEQIRGTEAELVTSVAQKDAALANYAGEVGRMTDMISDLRDGLAAQAEAFADGERRFRDREARIREALLVERKIRAEDHAARQSILNRMKSVFVAPASLVATDYDA